LVSKIRKTKNRSLRGVCRSLRTTSSRFARCLLKASPDILTVISGFGVLIVVVDSLGSIEISGVPMACVEENFSDTVGVTVGQAEEPRRMGRGTRGSKAFRCKGWR